jgi:hypothetical protein
MQAVSDRAWVAGAGMSTKPSDLWRITALSIVTAIVSSVRRRHFPPPVLFWLRKQWRSFYAE